MHTDREDLIRRTIQRDKDKMPLAKVDLPQEVETNLKSAQGEKPVSSSQIDETLKFISFLCEPRGAIEYLVLRRSVGEVLCNFFASRKKSLTQVLVGGYKWDFSPPDILYPAPVSRQILQAAAGVTNIINPIEWDKLKKKKKSPDSIAIDEPFTPYAVQQSRHISDKLLNTAQEYRNKMEWYSYLKFTRVGTKGVFDVGPHYGHNTLLERAKMVGGTWSTHTAMVDSDLFVQIFKGLERPYMDQELRCLNLTFNMFVDHVFSVDRYMNVNFFDLKYYPEQIGQLRDFVNYYWQYIYSLVRPNIMLLGKDRPDLLPIEHARCEPYGIMIVVNDYGPETSTTRLAEIIKEGRDSRPKYYLA